MWTLLTHFRGSMCWQQKSVYHKWQNSSRKHSSVPSFYCGSQINPKKSLGMLRSSKNQQEYKTDGLTSIQNHPQYVTLNSSSTPHNNNKQNMWCCIISTRWFKYDQDKLWLVYTQSVPVIFEPPCTYIMVTFCSLYQLLINCFCRMCIQFHIPTNRKMILKQLPLSSGHILAAGCNIPTISDGKLVMLKEQ
jgi:hypothetical protein